MPTSSPPGALSDLTDEAPSGLDDDDELDEAEGEDLFDDTMMADYRANPELDTYEQVGMDDEGEFENMDTTTRQLAEMRMARRDRAEGVGRMSRRAPSFLQSDDESDDGVLRQRRRRRHYDEAPDMDDEAMADELPLEQLSDIKADSIASWVATENVRRTIVREFRHFLVR